MAQQPTSLLFDLFVAGQLARTLLIRVMADAPLRPDQYAVFSAVVEFGPIAPTDLARRLGMPLTTLLEYTRSMEQAHQALRLPNPRDQRSYQLELTRLGRELHRQAGAVFNLASMALSAELKVPEAEARRVVQAVADAARAAGTALG